MKGQNLPSDTRKILVLLGLLSLLVAIAGCTAPEGGVTGQVTGVGEQLEAPTSYVWKEVARFQGQYDKVTDSFNISSDVWRIKWSCLSDRNGVLNVYVFPASSHVIYKSLLRLECPGTGQKYLQKGMKGSFFIKVRVDALDQWELLLEQ